MWSRLLFPIATLVTLATYASAAVTDDSTLEDEVRGARRIARVQLTSLGEVSFVAGGSNSTCGHRYHAKVRDALQGPAEDFDFFSNYASPEDAADHLLMVFELTADKRSDFRRRVESLPEPHRSKALCRLDSNFRYHASNLMVFDRTAAGDFGGEWLWPLEPLHSLEDLGRRQPVELDHEVLSWTLLRRVITTVLSGSQ